MTVVFSQIISIFELMNLAFYKTIEQSNASPKSRKAIAQSVVENLDHLSDLIVIAFNIADKNHHKAVWIFEILAEENPDLLLPFVDTICETCPKYQHESAIRGISRVIYFLATSKIIALTASQKEKCIEVSLDWLIGDIKVAPKVYAMYTLSYFMKEFNWLKDELKNTIDKDFYAQSSGYKAAAREVLKQIQKNN